MIADTDKGDGLNLKIKQKPPQEDGKDTLQLKPFEKPLDKDAKPSDGPPDQEPTNNLKGPEGERGNIDVKPGENEFSPKKRQRDDQKPKTKPGTLCMMFAEVR